jgi:hypothetical protein
MLAPVKLFKIFPAAICGLSLAAASGQDSPERQVLESGLIHLRSGAPREWASFPEQPDGEHLVRRFTATTNPREMALRLRQQDVKQAWRVLLNGKSLGNLVRDENDQILYLAIPAGTLKPIDNLLQVESPGRAPNSSDDIRVGEIWIEPRTMTDALSEATLLVRVVDNDSAALTPARITIVNSAGALQAIGTACNDKLAIRSGVVYTADGEAQIHLPAGNYTIYSGRGFEYSLAKVEVSVAAGDTAEKTLSIRREVPTDHYVACDTHIHTLTHSGHGDATIAERMITLAAEGIELPIATDHNVQIDYRPHAQRLNVRRFFTPVIGNEVTTTLGHFNVFPTTTEARPPDFKRESWSAIFDEIFGTPGVKVAVLNHPRDLHGKTRPFDPKLFNSAIGDNIEHWPMRFNAVEIINSGATQTDAFRSIQDWMALLNRGYRVTPVGSSDSHDVSRYIVGQGRTYIRAEDTDPGNIDIDVAMDNLLNGRVVVSYGLFVEPIVNDRYRPGDFAPLVGDQVKVELQVHAPSWSKATRLQLYSNGAVTSAIDITDHLKTSYILSMPRPRHDVHLVAVLTGPGITGPFWPTARPYQPASPDWKPYTLAVSGPIWLDGDGNGIQTTARGYAERLIAENRGDLAKVCQSLASFDLATAAQAADILRRSGTPIQALSSFEAFRAYLDAWRENERAQAQP